MAEPSAPGRGPSSRWGAVLLAAGASTRMGKPKQLLPVDGRLLVERAAATLLDAGFWPVAVVLGANAEAVRPALARLPILAVDNPSWMEGMASSLRAGIGALSQFSRSLPGALIALCDQPNLSPSAAQTLRAAAQHSPGGASAAHYAGHLGAPACFRREHFPALAALTGEAGARALLQQLGQSVTPVDLPGLAVDLDTPADYAPYASPG